MKEKFELKDLSDTARLAKLLAGLAAPGKVLLLKGDLGTGKTTLTRYIAEELGEVPENVTSPTFSIIHEYNSNPPIAHIDLYRLGPNADILDLGIDEYIDRGFFLIIEWAEYISDLLLFEDVMCVFLEFHGDRNRIAIVHTGRNCLGAI